MDWEKAENHLHYLISSYSSMGPAGCLAVRYVLRPLLERLESGEQTEDLYDEIMVCK